MATKAQRDEDEIPVGMRRVCRRFDRWRKGHTARLRCGSSGPPLRNRMNPARPKGSTPARQNASPSNVRSLKPADAGICCPKLQNRQRPVRGLCRPRVPRDSE